MPQHDALDTTPARSAPVVRVAGWVVVALGALNLVLAGIAQTTNLIRFSPSQTGGLAVLGLVTVALGLLVRRGLRWAVVVALVVFGGLFLVQVTGAGGGGGAAPAAITLAVVVLPLVLALRAGRRGA